MKKYDISIIIPAYNVEKYIYDCLQSVVMQDGISIEVICINDGSSDGTNNRISEFVDVYDFVSLLNQDNKGLSASRNVGIEKATGKYVMFLDADDMLACDGSLKKAFQIAVQYDVDFITFDGDSFFESEMLAKKNGHYASMYKRDLEYGLYENGYELLSELVERNMYYSSACLSLYNLNFLRANNIRFCEGVFYEDNPFSLQCYIQAKRTYHMKSEILMRRIRNDSIMQSRITADHFLSACKVYFQMRTLWENCSIPNKYKEQMLSVLDSIRAFAAHKYEEMDAGEKQKLGTLDFSLMYRINGEILTSLSRCEYVFPYHLFNENDHVVIYGAGNVGKSFYRRAVEDGIITIEAIVDQKGSVASDSEISVVNVNEELLSLNVYWLIAIEDEKIAKEAKEQLLSFGINEDRLLWDGRNYRKKNRDYSCVKFNSFINREMTYQSPRIYLFLQPEHGNLGDYAISLGEIRFLESFFPEYHIVRVTTEEWCLLNGYIKKMISDKDIIVLNGGGYIGDLWPSFSVSKEIVSCFPNNIKIFMPNTYTYSSLDFSSTVEFEKDLYWLEKQSNMYVFFRDYASYELTYSRSRINCFYAPDMALFLHNREENELSYRENNDRRVLLCMRNDRERTFDEIDKVLEVLKKCGYEYDFSDVHQGRKIELEQGYVEVHRYIDYIRRYEFVVTDRLHGMILSVLADVPCVVFDNSSRKLSGVLPWVSNERVMLVTDTNDLETIIQDVLTKEKTNDDRLLNGFDMMLKDMTRILKEG